jgi:hypothetical protein
MNSNLVATRGRGYASINDMRSRIWIDLWPKIDKIEGKAKLLPSSLLNESYSMDFL